MKLDRRMITLVLALCLLLGLAPNSSAASRSEKTFASIATQVYTRRLILYDGLVPACDFSGKWGVIDAQCETVIPFAYDLIRQVGFDHEGAPIGAQGYFLAMKDDESWVLLDPRGSVVMSFGEGFQEYSFRDRERGFAVYGSNKDEENRFYTWDLTPCTEEYVWNWDSEDIVYDEYSYDYSCGVYVAGNYDADGELLYGVLDKELNVILPFRYREIKPRTDGTFEVTTDDGKGLVDAAGQELIPISDDYWNDASFGELNPEGYISVSTYKNTSAGRDDLWTMIYRDGVLVKSVSGICGQTVSDTELLKYTADFACYGLMDLDWNTVIPELYKEFRINPDGSITAFLKAGRGKCGLYDKSGNQLLPDEYYSIEPVPCGRYIVTGSGNKKGLADPNGDFILPLGYSSIEYTSDNRFLVQDEEGCCLMDADGAVAVPVQYSIQKGYYVLLGYMSYEDGINYPNVYMVSDRAETMDDKAEKWIINGDNQELTPRWTDSFYDHCWGYCPLSDQYDPASDMGRILGPSSSGEKGALIAVCYTKDQGDFTRYIEVASGEVRAELPFRASAPTPDGYFIYKTDDGGYSLGNLEDAVYGGTGTVTPVTILPAPFEPAPSTPPAPPAPPAGEPGGGREYENCEIPGSLVTAENLDITVFSFSFTAEKDAYGIKDAIGYITVEYQLNGPAGISQLLTTGCWEEMPGGDELEKTAEQTAEFSKNSFALPHGMEAVLPLRDSGVLPVAENRVGKELYILLIGVDADINRLGYALVKVSLDIGPEFTGVFPTATQYVPYREAIPASLYSGSFALTAGALPAGLSLSASGVLSGIPTELGVFSFTVTETTDLGGTEHKCTLSVYSRMYADVEAGNVPGYGFVETAEDDGRVDDQTVSSKEELKDQVMHCQGEYSQFRELYLDARQLIRGVEYYAEEGGTRITVLADTIGGEGGGTHTLAAEFETEDGETVYTVQNYTVYGIAGREVHVEVAGETVIWTDAEPYIDTNNRTMTPFRAVGDALGLTIAWDSEAREASFSDGARTICFPIGSTTARTSEGTTIEMDTSAVIVNGRTYAPVRYLAEYFGYGVGWDAPTRTVVIG